MGAACCGMEQPAPTHYRRRAGPSGWGGYAYNVDPAAAPAAEYDPGFVPILLPEYGEQEYAHREEPLQLEAKPTFVDHFLTRRRKNAIVRKVLAFRRAHPLFDAGILELVTEGERVHHGIFTIVEILQLVRRLWPKMLGDLHREHIDVDTPSDNEVRHVFYDVDDRHMRTGRLERDELGDFLIILIVHVAERVASKAARLYGTAATIGYVLVGHAKWQVSENLRGLRFLLPLLPPSWFMGPLVGVAGAMLLEYGGLDQAIRHLPWNRETLASHLSAVSERSAMGRGQWADVRASAAHGDQRWGRFRG